MPSKYFTLLVAVSVSIVAAAGCKSRQPGGDSPGTTAPDPHDDAVAANLPFDAAPTASNRAWPSDAPSPSEACTTHDDCAVIRWDGPWPPDPCCDQRMAFTPVSKKYLTWMYEYREKNCQGVACPIMPFPGAEPACCVVQARCVKGACKRACDDPTADVPKISSLDPMCSHYEEPMPAARHERTPP
jgi:hypothetical protein